MFVFAYGSLIWRPGFPHLGAQAALLRGYHRRFCIWSRHYRGTPERPGLVLGLDRGGACQGVVFEVAADDAAAVLAYLDERENILGDNVYRRREVPVRLVGGGVAQAVTYVVNRTNPAYARPCQASAAAAIATAEGLAGSNRDYLLNTLRHLSEFGLRDAGLAGIAALLPGA